MFRFRFSRGCVFSDDSFLLLCAYSMVSLRLRRRRGTDCGKRFHPGLPFEGGALKSEPVAQRVDMPRGPTE